MLKTYIRDELATLGRLGILSVDEQEQRGRRRRLAASFVPNVSRRAPAATANPPRRVARSSAKRPDRHEEEREGWRG